MRVLICVYLIVLFAACTQNDRKHEGQSSRSEKLQRPSLSDSTEPHIANVRQLTFGSTTTFPRFSYNHRNVVFQRGFGGWGVRCDQVFMMNIEEAQKDTGNATLVSTGTGRAIGGYFMQDGGHILFSSSHLATDECPTFPDSYSGHQLWPIYDGFDIFVSDLDGDISEQLTSEPGYDAEATTSPKGDKIVFTSNRSGDLELYTMLIDGSKVKQITDAFGYDGSACFSPDGSKLVFLSSRPKTDLEIKRYSEYLQQGIIDPTHVEIFVSNSDGTDLRQVTELGGTILAPTYHPDGNKIIFSSNHGSETGKEFQLYTINEDGSGLEQITHASVFNAYPMFSFNGKKLLFSSSRNGTDSFGTNIFIADWIE